MDFDYQNKTVLILGATGLIGSACKRLFDQLDAVTLLTPSHSELELLNKDAVDAYFAQHKPDYVIFAAGIVGGIQFNKNYPADIITQNLQLQMNVFEAANAVEVEKLIFFASSCMYPKVCAQPMPEEALYTGHLEPTSQAYAVAKLAGIQMARAFNQQLQVDRFIVAVPNSVYGPNDNFDPETAHVMSSLMAKFQTAKDNNQEQVECWGSGEPRREFVYADDVAEAVAFLMQQRDVAVPINIGVGYDISIKELTERIAKTVGFNGTMHWDASKPNGTMKKLLDNQKITKLGWQAQTELDDGIKQTHKWYLTNILQREAIDER